MSSRYGNIEVGDVRHSRLSGGLTFTVSCDARVLDLLKEIVHNDEATPEALAEECRDLLERKIMIDYTRGGHRRSL